MTLEEFEMVDLATAESSAIMKARRMAAFTIEKVYEHHEDCDERLNDGDIDAVKDAMQIFAMGKERSAKGAL